MIDKLMEFFGRLWELLPKDPFREYIEEAAAFFETQEWIGILNYFVPLEAFVKIGTSWMSAVVVYMVYCRLKEALYGRKG